MIYRTLFFLLLVFLTGAGSFGQNQRSPVLEEYIREGISGNLELKQGQLGVSSSVEALRQAKALFYPKISFEPTYSVAFGGRRLAFPVGDMLNPAYAALNQLTGSDRFPTDIPNVNELLAPHNFHDTKVSFRYAVYNPEIRYNYLIQHDLLSAEEAGVRVVSAEVRYAISEAYYRYLQALKVLEVVKTTRATLSELVRLNTRLMENHVVTKDAVLSSEYEVSVLDQQQVEAEKDLRMAQSYFNFLLNRDLESGIEDDTLIWQAPGAPGGDAPLDEMISRALSGRPELQQLEYSSSAARQAVKLQEKSAALPSLFIGGNAGFQGFGYRFRDQGYLVAQAGLQWNLFNGNENKARIAQSRIRAQMLETRQTEAGRRIALEVTQASYAHKAAREALNAAGAAVEKAQAFYKVTDSRYRNQTVLMLEFVKAATDLQTARLRQAMAQYELLIRTAHLDRVTGAE